MITEENVMNQLTRAALPQNNNIKKKDIKPDYYVREKVSESTILTY